MNNQLRLLILLPLIIGVLGSCDKANGPELNQAVDSPGNVQLSIDRNTITANWEYASSSNIDYFSAELSTTSDFTTIIERDTLAADQRQHVYENVTVSTQYYFRVKAITPNRATSSAFSEGALQLESLLQSVRDQDVTGTTVTLRWTAPSEGSVTSIILQPQMGESREIELSQEEISSRAVTVENLTINTSYQAVLYDENIRKGVIEFRTVDTNALITIEGMSDEYASLQEAIAAASPGDIINMRGYHDNSENDGITIDKELTIRKLPSADEPPEVVISQFNLDGNPGILTVSDLRLHGTQTYVADVSAVTGNATLRLLNNNISGPEAGLIYASSDASAGTYGLVVDNSLIHDFGASGGDFIDFRAGSIAQLEIANSTFWNLARRFFRITDNAEYIGEDPPTFTQSTVNNVCTSSFFDIRTATAQIRFSNSILTNKNSDADNAALVELFAENVNTFGTNQDKFLQYFFGGTTNILHEDPQYSNAAGGDFTLGNSTLIENEWGDPRWF